MCRRPGDDLLQTMMTARQEKTDLIMPKFCNYWNALHGFGSGGAGGKKLKGAPAFRGMGTSLR